MPFRERIRRALRKSDSSSSMSQADTNTITTTTTARTSQSSLGPSGANGSLPNGQQPDPQPTSSSPSQNKLGLSKTFTWGRDREKEEKKREKKDDKRRRQTNPKKMHPSERPLTAQNLRHQEMLRQFTMTFGASDPNRVGRLSFQEGVSPCCTRPQSIYDDSTTSADESRYSQLLSQ